MIDMTKEDMDAVARAFEEEELAERRERALDNALAWLIAAAGLAFLALCWWLVRTCEAEGMERRAADPQGAEARVERRLMAEDASYRLCRRASAAVFALPAPAGGAE